MLPSAQAICHLARLYTSSLLSQVTTPAPLLALPSLPPHCLRSPVQLSTVSLLRGEVTTYEARYTPKLLGHYSCTIKLSGSPICGSPIMFDVLAGTADTKTSRIVPPEPPCFAGTNYELVLITVDRFGNECTKGGALISGKLQGSNMPPGQDPNVEVVDKGDGRYIFKLWLKAPADVKLYITIAKPSADPVLAADPKNMLEFAPVSLSFTSLKALRAKQERDARKAEKVLPGSSSSAAAVSATAGGAGASVATLSSTADASLKLGDSIGASGLSSLGAGASAVHGTHSMGAQSSKASGEELSSMCASDSMGHSSHRPAEKVAALASANPLGGGKGGKVGKGGKGAPPNTNPLGIGAKLRAAGAELISEVYAPKTAPDDGSASLGGAAAVVDMFIDGMRKDVAKSKARRVQTRNDTEYR